MPEPIYLDCHATTPLLPAAEEAMRGAQRSGFANPSSQHAPGRAARRIVENARSRACELLGADPSVDRLLFTSGGSEANTLALRGLLHGRSRRLVVSSIEHPSVAATADRLAAEGVRVDRLGVDRDGVAQLEQLGAFLKDGEPIGLVSLMLANNETGVLQPVAEAARLCRQAGVPLHADACQAVGKIGVDFSALGATAISFAAHKFHGPVGIGGLLLREGVSIAPLANGGPQQGGLRPGTESAPLAAGLLAALEASHKEHDERFARMTQLRDRLESELVASWPGAVVPGSGAPRLPTVSCLAFVGADRQAAVMAYDLAGVACSTGSACASGSSEPSPTLLAMGLDRAVVDSAVRLSLGAATTADEIRAAIDRITAANRCLPTASQALK